MSVIDAREQFAKGQQVKMQAHCPDLRELMRVCQGLCRTWAADEKQLLDQIYAALVRNVNGLDFREASESSSGGWDVKFGTVSDGCTFYYGFHIAEKWLRLTGEAA